MNHQLQLQSTTMSTPRSDVQSPTSTTPDYQAPGLHGVQGSRVVKQKVRRVKANTRERNRMHGLNNALETLRQYIPLASQHQRLSKIETLRLARNYIAVLSRTLQCESMPDPMEYAYVLTRGLSQTTTNMIASSCRINPRSLMADTPPLLPQYSPDMSCSPLVREMATPPVAQPVSACVYTPPVRHHSTVLAEQFGAQVIPTGQQPMQTPLPEEGMPLPWFNPDESSDMLQYDCHPHHQQIHY